MKNVIRTINQCLKHIIVYIQYIENYFKLLYLKLCDILKSFKNISNPLFLFFLSRFDLFFIKMLLFV